VNDLLKVYDTGDQLDAKWAIMRRYRVSELSFEDWVLGQIELPPAPRVLDVGAGSGRFTLPLARALRDSGVTMVALDISAGVMAGLRDIVAQEGLPVQFRISNVDAADLGAAAFDLIVAGHMLYHLHRPRATLDSLRRALTDHGEFVATTNGRVGMPELYDLHLLTMRRLGMAVPEQPADEIEFTAENGAAFLEGTFDRVRAEQYDGGFTAADGATIFAYYAGTQLYRARMADEAVALDVRSRIADTYLELAQGAVDRAGGELLISKPMTAFYCRP